MNRRGPVGRGVAFTSEGKILIPGVGYDTAVYLNTLKSNALTLLSATVRGRPIYYAQGVRWSPNGKRIVFATPQYTGHVYAKTLR